MKNLIAILSVMLYSCTKNYYITNQCNHQEEIKPHCIDTGLYLEIPKPFYLSNDFYLQEWIKSERDFLKQKPIKPNK